MVLKEEWVRQQLAELRPYTMKQPADKECRRCKGTDIDAHQLVAPMVSYWTKKQRCETRNNCCGLKLCGSIEYPFSCNSCNAKWKTIDTFSRTGTLRSTVIMEVGNAKVD